MSRRKPETYVQARLQILHYILEFCLTHRASGQESGEHPRMWPGIEGFIHQSATRPVEIGDLVVLSSTRVGTKFQLGWLIEQRSDKGYLIQSLEDQTLCWWSNVGISYLPRDKVSAQWRWSDSQHDFAKRWDRVCYRKHDAYITLPTPPKFGENGEVTLGVRTRFGFDEFQPERTLPDWRKLKVSQLSDCYLECEAESKALRQQAKAAAEPVG